ncbi:hypothetical protein DPV79_16030 [Burkholderia reimsis]|uniref:Uncharacterized protein n=1 Tax=Burkholderia reimsis TaxID=2234132 RepID=A0A365QV07_9BURK|nr:hypothetical protein [Burkholderia reimsis]RBB38888.1 hypothetical protein DPV79_16030 [Burkholderia reimsis]
MNEQQWTFVDRSDWESGEWDNEPDKVQWTDEATRLVCMAHRGPMGNWCGYVGVPPAHPLYAIDYSVVQDKAPIDVHGGLTYAEHCQPNHDPITGRGVCHIPEPGEPDDLWWLGFDCGHAFDLQPGLRARLKLMRDEFDLSFRTDFEQYRTLDYVRKQAAYLAAQLAELA